ncbi:MAG: M20/M25/M40 family metallo-hydrolase, partial [Christensenellales bacterium]
AGAAVVQSLQTIVSRFTSPMDSVVVTDGSFHAGTRCNIIAQDAVLEGTLRAFDDNVHARLIEHFKRIITDVSAAYGCTAEIDINEVAGVVVNDEALCRIANECAAELVPPDRIQPQHPCMLGDDFASYRAIAPSCFVQVGMLAPEKDCCYAHHHGMFKVDEDVLPLCAAWMAAMAARAASR